MSIYPPSKDELIDIIRRHTRERYCGAAFLDTYFLSWLEMDPIDFEMLPRPERQPRRRSITYREALAAALDHADECERRSVKERKALDEREFFLSCREGRLREPWFQILHAPGPLTALWIGVLAYVRQRRK